MDIGYGDCLSLVGNHYVITLVDRSMYYVWIYGMHALYGSNVIQALQEFMLYAGQLTSKFDTDFEEGIIRGAVCKWVLAKGSKIVAAPSGWKRKNGPVKWAFKIFL